MRGARAGAVVALGALGLPFLLIGLLALGAAVAPAGVGAEAARPARDFALLARMAGDWALLARTLGVALAVGALATAFALTPAWATRSLGARWWPVLLVPLLLPAPLAYAAWGLLRAPGTLLAALLERGSPGVASVVAGAHAVIALALWAWPLALLVLAPAARRIDGFALDAARLRSSVARAAFGALRPAMLISVALVALVMLGSAVPLHLAQAQTWAIVVWRELDATGGGAGTRGVWIAAAPLLVVALLGGMALGAALGAGERDRAREEAPAAERRMARAVALGAIAAWGLAAVVPIALMALHLREARSLARVWSIIGEGARSTAATALVVGVCAFAVACATAFAGARDAPRWSRRAAAWSVGAWAALGVAPGVLVGSALLSASTILGLGWLAESRAGVVVAHIARFGAAAALAGWWLARVEPQGLAEQRALIAPRSVAAWIRTAGRAGAGLLCGAAAACAALSAGEIESAVVLTPPGTGNLARTLLQQLHYLRMEELVAGGAQLMLIGLLGALGVALLAGRSLGSWRGAARAAPALLMCVGALQCVGCGASDASGADAARPLRTERALSEAGLEPGQVLTPRAIDSDGVSLWVIDKSGRVQRLGPDGAPQGAFTLPSVARGYPVGVTCGPDGLVYIADTHEHRVLVCRPLAMSGPGGPALEEVARWGAYGKAPSEFIYTTDVAILPGADGRTAERIYVGEYGGNDRISVFDGAHTFLFSFGTQGSRASAERVEFDRPQSLLLDARRRVLFVADSSNHRVGVFTLDGALVKWIGKAGVEDGAMRAGAGGPGRGACEFNYPYGLAMLADGSLLVTELGNGRVQRIDPDSERCIALAGRPGRGEGELAEPWGVALLGGLTYVLDTGNHRIFAIKPPEGAGG